MKNRPIRIIHIISSLKRGGAETVLVNILRCLPSSEYEHHVIYFHKGPYAKVVQEMAVPVYHIEGYIWRYDPIFWIRIAVLFVSLRPDIIHSSLWAACLVARLLGPLCSIPVVCAIHTCMGHHGILRNFIDSALLPYPTAFVGVSCDVIDSFKKQFPSLPTSILHVINNGVDIPDIKCEEDEMAATDFYKPPHTFVIGMVARFVPVKQHALVIEAFARLYKKYPQVILLLVGEGPLEGDIRALVDTYCVRERVFFAIGRQASSYYVFMDCFVLPSSHEGLSMALLEAMAFGIACITTANKEMVHPAIVHNENGVIIGQGSVIDIERWLCCLIENREYCKGIGAQAKKTVLELFSLTSMGRRYAQLFEEIVYKKPCS